MEIKPQIFKSYDIRGIYPTDLNKEAAFKIGQVFAKKTEAKLVAVGQDMRVSSLSLFDSLIKGILSQGADVCNIGLVPTEGIYFATAYYNCDAGIMITASHNPKEYNGFKMVKKEKKWVKIIPGKDLEQAVRQRCGQSKKIGKMKKLDIWQDYIKHIFSFVDLKKIKPLKVVIDASNGMAGKVVPKLSSKLPIKIIPLNFKLDGNFPAHSPNPLLEESRKQICKIVLEEKADFGFIFDGDGDRIFLIDEKANFIRGDITLLLLAKYLLKKHPGKGIAYNVICSKSVPEFLKKWGAKLIRTKVGFINIQEAIIKNKGIMGGELSGHYSFKDNFYLDSGFIAFLILLQAISESNKKVSQLAEELSSYEKSQEINFELKDKEAIIKKFREQFSDGKQDYLDGLTVEYRDWWFNLRPSNTEPLLRLTIEAKTLKLLNQKQNELSSLILN